VSQRRVLDKLARKGEIVVAYVDSANRGNRELFREFEVRGIPALFWYENGELIEEAVGYQDADEVLAVFDD
jgi:thioredoxin-related protein